MKSLRLLFLLLSLSGCVRNAEEWALMQECQAFKDYVAGRDLRIVQESPMLVPTVMAALDRCATYRSIQEQYRDPDRANQHDPYTDDPDDDPPH